METPTTGSSDTDLSPQEKEWQEQLKRKEKEKAERRDKLEGLEMSKARLLWELASRDRLRARILSVVSALLILILAAEVAFADPFYSFLTNLGRASESFFGATQSLGFFGRIGVLWFLTLGVAYALLVVPNSIRQRAGASLEDDIKKIEEEILLIRTDTPGHQREYLEEEVRRLTNVTARVFLDNPERSALANQWREQAEDILRQVESYQNSDGWSGRVPDLSEAQSLISSINELILREENELREQRNWRSLAMGIMVVYIIGLVAIVLLTGAAQSNAIVPVFGIPISVILWGAMGSLAAILYKFYTERQRVRFDLEVRWLIARPIIGIIMGGVAYLGLVAGLVLLNTGSTSGAAGVNTSTPPGRLEVYWIIAFLAGFSDKFYLRIINLLVEKTVGEDEDKNKTQGAGGEGVQAKKTPPEVTTASPAPDKPAGLSS